MGVFKQGACKAKCKLNTDVVFPKDILIANCDIDNRACKKPIEKYILKLVRRIEIINLTKK